MRFPAPLLVAAILLGGCGDDGTPPPTDAGGVDAGPVVVRAVPEGGEPPPCKVTVEGIDGTTDPAWAEPIGEWVDAETFLVGRSAVALRCDIELTLAPGRYRLTVSRGLEHEAAVAQIEVGAAAPAPVEVSLPRVVESAGWACVDLHVHSAPSFDSDVPQAQRLLSAVTEGLDAFAATDHDALQDWEGPRAEAGIGERLAIILGDELTPDTWPTPSTIGHAGLFPLDPTFDPAPLVLRSGGIEELVSAARAAAPDAMLQINHPRWNGFIGQFASLGLSNADRFDLVEVWNGHELDARAEGGSTLDEVLRDWWSLLDAGVQLAATANSDSHRLEVTPVGYPRTCVPVPEGLAGAALADAVVEALRAGAAFGTSGPFVTLQIDGAGPGELVAVTGTVSAEVTVQAPSWVDVRRVHFVVEGEMVATEELPGPFPATAIADLAVTRDTWALVLVEGDAPLGVATGLRNVPLRSFAFTNPVYLDADGDGLWTPPGP